MKATAMDYMDYFLEVYGTLPRAGPGDDASTRKAYGMMAEDLPAKPRVLDLGCGPGKQTLELVRCGADTVVALDVFQQMIGRVEAAAREAGVSSRVETLKADMTTVEFAPGSFDVVWSEGSLYFMGFARGLRRIRPWLKPGGFVGVSEAVWLCDDPPEEAVGFWEEYPEIDRVERKLEVIAESGYEPVGHFVLPRSSWTNQYYDPMSDRVAQCARKWAGVPEAEAVLEEARAEIATYNRCGESFSYAFFVVRKPAC